MKKKIIATLCAALMLSGVITGCSGSASSGSQAAASTGTSANTASGAEGKTTLNVLWWGSQTRHEMTTEMLEKFEELNPDIDVVMDYSDWDGYWTKLPAQVAGGQTPDVFQMDYAKLAEYVENGVTADLSSYIADGSLDYEQRRAEYSGLRHSGRQSLRDLYWYECACYAVSQGHFG